jgi:hypothetical protein
VQKAGNYLRKLRSNKTPISKILLPYKHRLKLIGLPTMATANAMYERIGGI